MATKADLPSFAEYFHPTLTALKHRGGSATIEEIEDAVAELMSIPSDQLAVPHGTGTRTQFQYELAWVRTYLKRVGALDNSERGVWSLTEAGEKLNESEARAVVSQVRSQDYYERRQTQRPEAADEVGDVAINDSATWIDKLLEVLGRISPEAFERLAQRLLREAGFIKVDVTGRAGDGGIDGVGVLRVNLVSFHVLFQCKRWKSSVGSAVVRDFRGAMVGRADKGLIITTSTFTADARKEAIRDGAPAIDLVDGEALCELLKEYRLGIAVRTVEEIGVDEPFFLAI